MTKEQFVLIARKANEISHWAMEGFYGDVQEKGACEANILEKIAELEEMVTNIVDSLKEPS